MATQNCFEVPVDEFGTIVVEIAPIEGLHEVSAGDVLQNAAIAFDKVTQTIEICAKGFISHIHQMERKSRPQEVSIEFGIALKADAGVVLVHTSTEGNFKVTLKWTEKADET